jgi:hypothetical protein
MAEASRLHFASGEHSDIFHVTNFQHGGNNFEELLLLSIVSNCQYQSD